MALAYGKLKGLAKPKTAAKSLPSSHTPQGAGTPRQGGKPLSQPSVPQIPDAQLGQMENRLAMAGSPRIGGRGAKPGATYRHGEFKGLTAGQAWAKMQGETPGQSPNSTGGRSAPYSAAGKVGGIDAYNARQGRSLAADIGLVPAQQAGTMSPLTRATAVSEFRNSPGVVDRNRYEATQPVLRNVTDSGAPMPVMSSKAPASRLFGAAPGQSPVQPTAGASTGASDPVSDLKQVLNQAAQPVTPATPATPAAPAATAKAPAAGAKPEKRPS